MLGNTQGRHFPGIESKGMGREMDQNRGRDSRKDLIDRRLLPYFQALLFGLL